MQSDPADEFPLPSTAPDPRGHGNPGRPSASWARVLFGMATGRITVGSPVPVGGFPAWLTPEIIRGGFATGRAMAGGPLESDERDLAGRLGVPPSRAHLFAWFLTDVGMQALDAWLASGLYRLELPEHGALLTVAWLRKHGHPEEAADVVEALRPWAPQVRFWPYDAPSPEAPGVHVVSIPTVADRLERRTPRPQIEAEREVLSVWNPFTDEVLTHWWATRSSTGMVGSVLTPEWIQGAESLLEEYQRLAAEHTLTTRHADSKENLQILLTGLRDCVTGDLDARMMGWVRAAVAGMVAKRGEPGSPKLAALRAAQARTAALPSHAVAAHDAAARLRASGLTGGAADPLALLADSPGRGLPSVRSTTHQATQAPVAVLLDEGIIRSAEMLADLAPQITAETVASRYTDTEAGVLARRLYRAFTQRRSVLLLDKQSQVTVHAVPWFALLERFNVRDPQQDLAHAQAVELATLALRHFPGTPVPNALIRELRHLFGLSAEDVPLTYELAADIFTGSFTPTFLHAARQAATLLGGTLYARYYRIDYDEVLALDPTPQTASRRRTPPRVTAPDFDTVVRSRAGIDRLRWRDGVASRGQLIEQAQLLTTHNLAALVTAGVILDWPAQARRSWAATTAHLAKTGGPRALHHRKNAAAAWRQTLFFLALCSPREVFVFSNEEGLRRGLSPEAGAQADTLLRGLRDVMELGSSSAGPFLGWVGRSPR